MPGQKSSCNSSRNFQERAPTGSHSCQEDQNGAKSTLGAPCYSCEDTFDPTFIFRFSYPYHNIVFRRSRYILILMNRHIRLLPLSGSSMYTPHNIVRHVKVYCPVALLPSSQKESVFFTVLNADLVHVSFGR
ncbi:unnamed protein product [Chondrus crispus]|uniref:Uncharacterized protein n=1 Tax=Chondrus crispus TaxID=2769 RepID=R7Q399_CHOCR|nr:unnamed protein product [Chondrus crispus]CDF33012.1 unnamed protein product [Chondrus crispus]|eukprot:XP_005712815.1 unnamed protein product [Chondrus crispus]